MNDTYFDYIVSRVKFKAISKACTANKTMQELLDSMNQFPELLYSVKSTTLMTEYLARRMQRSNCRNLSSDAEVLRQRVEQSMRTCQDELHQGRIPDFDELFDRSVESCWLLGSIEKQTKSTGSLKLIVDPDERLNYARCYLHEMYKQAISEYNEIIYISEALETRKHIFAGLFMPPHEEARKYVSINEYSYDDLCNMRDSYSDESNHLLASYYGLTATLMYAYQIRRGIV